MSAVLGVFWEQVWHVIRHVQEERHFACANIFRLISVVLPSPWLSCLFVALSLLSVIVWVFSNIPKRYRSVCDVCHVQAGVGRTGGQCEVLIADHNAHGRVVAALVLQ